MKANYPSLMPILRSDVQGSLLAILFVNKDREFSVSELAARARTSLPTALREIRRLEAVKFVTVRPSGNMQMIKINENHPLAGAMSEIVLYSFGPVEVLRHLVATLVGLEGAWIYGSWAARYQGVPGVDPGDIDVLLIGDLDRSKTYEMERQATEMIGKEVAVNNLSVEEWNKAESGFVQTVKSRPMVNLQNSKDT